MIPARHPRVELHFITVLKHIIPKFSIKNTRSVGMEGLAIGNWLYEFCPEPVAYIMHRGGW
jgi:hypothetical protein